jgi:hypothetical protein
MLFPQSCCRCISSYLCIKSLSQLQFRVRFSPWRGVFFAVVLSILRITSTDYLFGIFKFLCSVGLFSSTAIPDDLMVRHFLPAEGTQNGKSKCLLQLKKERNWLRCQSLRSRSKIKIKSNISSNLKLICVFLHTIQHVLRHKIVYVSKQYNSTRKNKNWMSYIHIIEKGNF